MEEQKIQLELEKHKLQQQMLQKQQEVSSIRLFGGKLLMKFFLGTRRRKSKTTKRKRTNRTRERK